MLDNQNENQVIDNSMYSHYVGVKFATTPRAYFFGYKDLDIVLDDMVVVETSKGIEVGQIAFEPIEIEKYKSSLALKPIIRKATDIDLKMYELNKKDAKYAFEICKNEVKRLGLDMHLISCEYSLDKSKVLFSYLADDRVDFRELLKVLASRLHSRIELRQIGPRDKAKAVGGLGLCGLPLCCSTFLNEFDGISIGRAKNQMLVINIPKLSGQCGKLICCLKYEDEAYSQERAKYPELGSKLIYDNKEYIIANINILSGLVRIDNPEDIKFVPYEDLKKSARFLKSRDNRENNEKK